MAESADAAAAGGAARRLSVTAGQVVQELGYDADVDHDLRDGVEDAIGGEMLDEDAVEAVDVVLLWWRDGDGDLVDALVDSLTSLAENGVVWLLSPKSGRPGHVEPADIDDAAPTAGLHATSTLAVTEDWSGTRLVTRSRKA
ncbi:DUF3052 domain-containing protein [Pseudokineococcus basanitobsidens]|uniref:DUF3052 domain-containing protein n=1 Tax=Pseudokineococcus basanitobsidens TaxID=1926649 RepID=A0ABU8RKQ5_9ACTN